MNVLWTKEKLHKIFSRDVVTLHAHASGDGGSAPGRCCRLCGGDTGLRSFGETYVWEGVEERYDHLLYDCFGVRVSPSDCMICDRCVRQLRSTQRFRALVYAAFDRPPTECSSNHSTLIESIAKLQSNQEEDKQIIKLLKTKVFVDNPLKRREVRREKNMTATTEYKRGNVACTVCKQRYPMIMPFDQTKNFICSRCKKNKEAKTSMCRKCNVVMATNMMKDHLELHAKADLRGKSRLCSLSKKPSQIKRPESVARNRVSKKFGCRQCPKKYLLAQNLAEHVRSVHGDSLNCLCAICGKNMKTRDLLDKHLKIHTVDRILQCDVCYRIFKGKRAFETHCATHGKKASSN